MKGNIKIIQIVQAPQNLFACCDDVREPVACLALVEVPDDMGYRTEVRAMVTATHESTLFFADSFFALKYCTD